jgi:hypothetical protein
LSTNDLCHTVLNSPVIGRSVPFPAFLGCWQGGVSRADSGRRRSSCHAEIAAAAATAASRSLKDEEATGLAAAIGEIVHGSPATSAG